MAYDRFLIAPLNSGLQTDLKPFLIPDEAYPRLKNAYVFRGRVRKRFGSRLMGTGASSAMTAQLLSRLRINIGSTDASGDFPLTAVPGSTVSIGATGQMFSVGNQIFTVYQASGALYKTSGSGSGTFNTATSQVQFTGVTALTAVYYYPALPVMGITNYENGPINNQPSYAFDTRFAYKFSGSGWERSGSGTNPLWHGNDSQFFWVCNWEGATSDVTAMFVTNFNATVPTPNANDDPIWVTQDGSTWSVFTPYFMPAGGAPQTGPFVKTARIIVSFKNRLLLLNTIENDNAMSPVNKQYKNRCRYSFNGSPFAPNAWYEPNQSDNAGLSSSNAAGAGFIDATTEEAIVSAEFIKDRLIVYFERSTWELAYTGNEILPFVWQKINTELGSEATFSSVPFDKVILTVGSTGIHACSGANVERIDNKIPDEIFEIKNKNEGVQRVAGIRDYYTEMVYWTFPSSDGAASQVFPNRILVYNYKNGGWAINDDCITAWGYFEQQQDITWAAATFTWETANSTWTSGVLQSQFRQIIAGNQQGFVFIVDPNTSRNAGVMQVTNITIGGSGLVTLKVIDHTLAVGEYVALENAQGISAAQTIYQVVSVTDEDTLVIQGNDISGTYAGGGTLARVSNIDILSKQWNFYLGEARNTYIPKIDFFVQKTTNGEVTIDYYPSSTSVSLREDGIATGSILGTSVLETKPYALVPLESQQDRLVHPVYLQADGECIQIRIYMNDTQITNKNIAFSDFVLEGLCVYSTRTSMYLR